MLAYDDKPASFIDSPALEVAAKALAGDPPAEKQGVKPPVARQIGAYQLLSRLGKGGMGEVHLALDSRLGRKVAVKLLPAEFTTDAARLRRFAQEARAASALNHPNILTIYEIGEAQGEHYIVTEYVEVLEGVVRRAFAVLEKGIYYIDQPSGEYRLQFFDFATGKTTTVSRNLGKVLHIGLTSSPDGRTILYSRVDSSDDDLMLVENFR